jgi:tetratricopeptide (TPR) repeat protein
MDDLNARDNKSALEKLNDARSAALHTDPLDPDALTQRGFIAKTLAQVAEAMNDKISRQKYYEEAAKLFQHVIHLDPYNPGANNGLGNIEHALGNIDAAILAYKRAIDLLPTYTATHHDLAIALEVKMQNDPKHKNDWCQKAVEEWQKT